jgi:hypothetical protein
VAGRGIRFRGLESGRRLPAGGRAAQGGAAILSAVAAAPAALDLRPPRYRVSRTAIRYWALRALAGWTVVAAAQVIWLVAAGDAAAPQAAPGVAT